MFTKKWLTLPINGNPIFSGADPIALTFLAQKKQSNGSPPPVVIKLQTLASLTSINRSSYFNLNQQAIKQ